MALITEDGTGRSDAESYASVAEADAYQASRGRTLWSTISEAEKEQALRRATDWMLTEYRSRWQGQRRISTQALDWPRGWVVVDGFSVASDTVPAEVKRACIEMAFRAASGDLLADQGAQVQSKTVGPISVTYAPGARQSTKYALVDGMVRALLSSGGSLKLVRA